MDETDVELWFEEEKETLVKAYFKKIDSLLAIDKTGTSQEVKQALHMEEEDFLEQSDKLRKAYEDKLTKVREKAEKEETSEKRKQKIPCSPSKKEGKGSPQP